MKKFVSTFVFAMMMGLGLGSAVQANGRDVDAQGSMFGVWDAGKVKRVEATLTAAPMGAKPFVLKYENKTVTSHAHKVIRSHGRPVLYVVFVEGDKAYLLRGSYIRGSNKAVYWGDIYKRIPHPAAQSLELLDSAVEELEAFDDGLESPMGNPPAKVWSHKGGFAFKAAVGS